MHENTDKKEYAVLAAVDTGEYDIDVSLAELEELADTAGIITLAQIVQKRSDFDRSTCIGMGKLEELRDFIQSSETNLIVFDHELSATQLRNIEELCGVTVIDRTMLILEIFASRARSREGKIQVELARDKYLLPRLTGMGRSLSRLGGGGGGAGAGARRGKGETRLELDRRHIRRRIRFLESELKNLEFRRREMRRRREKDGVTTAAIVGYTNAGKSTLMNTLTGAGVYAEDKLFATLDTTARSIELPDGRSLLLVDTVGMIRRLPHHLVDAFKSTLEEAVHSDLLLNICDMSSEDAANQLDVTNSVLSDLGATDIPVLTVLNKCDKVEQIPFAIGANTAVISAKTGFGIEELLRKISSLLEPSQRRMKLLIPYDCGGLIAEIRREGKIFTEQYQEEGTFIDALIDKKLIGKIQNYCI